MGGHAMKPRKRAQSFFQPLCIILSSLFLGPKTSCSEPRIFYRTPRHLFLDLWCFLLTCAGETHTQGEEKQIAKSGKMQIRKQKPSKGIKGQATRNRQKSKFLLEKATRKALQRVKSNENKLKGTRKRQQEQTTEESRTGSSCTRSSKRVR